MLNYQVEECTKYTLCINRRCTLQPQFDLLTTELHSTGAVEVKVLGKGHLDGNKEGATAAFFLQSPHGPSGYKPALLTHRSPQPSHEQYVFKERDRDGKIIEIIEVERSYYLLREKTLTCS